jgi:predicted short-subunit dehydrogenase-like oxidoreductase (DUF2520 family)
MKAVHDIAIIGPGKVGTAIAILAARAGYRIASIGARDRRQAARASAIIKGRPGVEDIPTAAASASIVLLSVTDSAIEPLCDELAGMGAFTPGCTVAHCCGALGSDILHSAKERCSCQIASMHPLQTFPSAQAAVKSMKGAHFFCEGDAQAVTTLKKLIRAIGGQAVELAGAEANPRAKALYHASACLASNYLVALMDAALTTAKLAGLPADQAWAGLEKLVQATLENISTVGPADALTGPIARGDVATVKRHLQALAGEKELTQLYRAMGQWTVKLAGQKGSIDKSAMRRLSALLGQ